MTGTARPSLEDLRSVSTPAWLWDADRRRIVWANAAGLAAFGCNTLFELVDKVFDSRDPGVERLAGLANNLGWGAETSALLHFPSAKLGSPFACSVHVHALGDGRPGLLALVKDQVVKVPPPSHQVLDSLPISAAVLSEKGTVLHVNPAMIMLLDNSPAHEVAAILESRSLELLDKPGISQAGTLIALTVGGVERKYRAKLSPVNSFGTGNFMLLLEALKPVGENVKELPVLPQQESAPLVTKQEAFAQLSKSLNDSLLKDDVANRQVAQADKTGAAAAAVPARFPPPPKPVADTLESAPHGIVVCRAGEALFATARAASLLGHDHAPAIITDTGVLAHLASVPTGVSTIVDLQRPGLPPLLVTRLPLPWHNGPAEQFTLKPYVSGPTKDGADLMPGDLANKVPVTTSPQIAPREAAIDQRRAEVSPTPSRPVQDGAEAMALEELKAILDVASDGIVTLSRDGEILSFSAAAEAIFGMTSAEAAGRPLRDLLHADSRKALRDYMAGLGGSGLGAVFNDGREMTAINAQGGHVPLFVTMGKLQSPLSNARFCAVVRDLTPWKKTERELIEARERSEAANRQKSELLARVSHELRTPLNAILGFSDVMRTQRFGALGNDKYLAYANDIHSGGSHLLALVNDLLDLAKVEAGKLELDFMAVSPEDAIDYSMRMMQEEAAQSGVLLRKSVAANLPRVVGDQKTLRQALINLVSNGVKYTDAGGEVMISALLQDTGTLTIRVRDTGIGMTAKQLEEALQPFGRVETASRQRQGTGLGLPLTRSLVEANRARFSLTSTPGQGTLAEISFPGPRVLAE